MWIGGGAMCLWHFCAQGAVGVWVGEEPEDNFSMVFHIGHIGILGFT